MTLRFNFFINLYYIYYFVQSVYRITKERSETYMRPQSTLILTLNKKYNYNTLLMDGIHENNI